MIDVEAQEDSRTPHGAQGFGGFIGSKLALGTKTFEAGSFPLRARPIG
jgi:hypothetical protein